MDQKLYEINTRVWLKKKSLRLSEIDFSFFEDLRAKGFDIVWLMGIWKTSIASIEKNCFNNGLINSYNKAVKDWRREDIIGSPYAIDTYEVNPDFGSYDDLMAVKEKLNSIGLKLFLDFIPNHFNCDSQLLKTNPEIFLKADSDIYHRDNFTFFKHEETNNIFAHGRDPLFPAWTDTVQINIFSREAREFLTQALLNIARLCDGVRCDMAMLPLNNVFNNTWLGVLNKLNIEKPANEFWKEAIAKVKEEFPGFIFLAEAYWDLEWELQLLGFDYTYDKRLLDRLSADETGGIKAHLTADKSYQVKLVRFIENHDEYRAVTKFGKQKSLAAVTVISTVQGLKLYYDGQLEGKKIKLPVQMGREPEERVSQTVLKYYEKLLKITNENIFKEGDWVLLEPGTVGYDNYTCENILAWQWSLNNERRIIVINYSESASQCRLKFEIESHKSEITLTDLLNSESYTRVVDEIKNTGLYIDLKPYNSHIFSFTV